VTQRGRGKNNRTRTQSRRDGTRTCIRKNKNIEYENDYENEYDQERRCAKKSQSGSDMIFRYRVPGNARKSRNPEPGSWNRTVRLRQRLRLRQRIVMPEAPRNPAPGTWILNCEMPDSPVTGEPKRRHIRGIMRPL
jgi:hypothetical protein